jgi:hypothetical protein
MNRDFQNGNRVHLIEWEKYQKLQTNRVKTSRLLAKDALESWIWEKAKVGFAPTAVSLLSKVSSGS